MVLNSADVLLNQVDSLLVSEVAEVAVTRLLPLAVEACWVIGKWEKLRRYVALKSDSLGADFNICLGNALLALHDGELAHFSTAIQKLRESSARNLSPTTTASIQACHETMLRFHALSDLEAVSGVRATAEIDRRVLLGTMYHRLNVLGAFLSDKQYLLGIQRAAMQLSPYALAHSSL